MGVIIGPGERTPGRGRTLGQGRDPVKGSRFYLPFSLSWLERKTMRMGVLSMRKTLRS
jgi:hypothetical protein